MPITTFHGSATGDITRFYRFSHFGSEESAFAAASRSCEKIGAAQGWLYKVSLRVERIDLAVVNDYGTASLRALATALQARWFPFKHLFENLRYTDKPAITLLNDYLRRAHKQGFAYCNRAEDCGSTSYCVADPNRVKILGCRKLGIDELKAGHGHLSEGARRLLELSNTSVYSVKNRPQTRAVRRGLQRRDGGWPT